MFAGQENEYLGRADQALLGHRFDDAVTDYLKAVTYSNPRDARLIWDDLGCAYLEKGLKKEAAGYLDQYFILSGKNEGDARELSNKLKNDLNSFF